MVKDNTLYDYLEISNDASDSDVKKAYKKLAFKYLPTKNSDTKEEFKKISDAYYILSNLEKRLEYDESGTFDASDYDPFTLFQETAHQDFVEMTNSFESVNFDELKAPPLKIPLSLSMDESFFGVTKKIKFRRMIGNPDQDYGTEPPPPDQLTTEVDELEIEIPVGAAPGENQVFLDRGHNIPNVGKSDLIVVYVDEDEYNESIKPNLEEDGVLNGNELEDEDEEEVEDEYEEDNVEDDYEEEEQEEDEDENENEEEQEENEDDTEDGEFDFEEDEGSIYSESTVEEEGKYKFQRGDNNNLDLTLKISLKELYCGVERSIKYFGGKTLHIGHYDKIDTDQLYCVPGYGINGADLNIRFHLQMPRRIPLEHLQEFVALMDKICKNRTTTDFTTLDPNDIKSLILKEPEDFDYDEDEDEEDEEQDESLDFDNQELPPQCTHQ